MRISRTAFLIGIAIFGGCAAADEAKAPADTTVARASRHGDEGCDWPQWGSDPAYTGQACKGTRRLERIVAHHTFNPFTEEEKADAAIFRGEPALLTHHQSPLLVGNDVYMEFKTGQSTSCAEDPVSCGPFGWNSQVWTEKKLRWHGGLLVEDWTFASDWKPEPGLILPDGGVLYGAFTGYNGFRGHLFKIDKHGQKVAAYDFSGDATPAVYRHNGTYSIAIEDNHSWTAS
jgi:hypothetical protein